MVEGPTQTLQMGFESGRGELTDEGRFRGHASVEMLVPRQTCLMAEDETVRVGTWSLNGRLDPDRFFLVI
jgi:hypothetical protein